jgi:hypothetical protein
MKRHDKHSKAAIKMLLSELKNDIERLRRMRSDWEDKRTSLRSSYKQTEIDMRDFFAHAIDVFEKMQKECEIRTRTLVEPYITAMDSAVNAFEADMAATASICTTLQDYLTTPNDVTPLDLMRARYEGQQKHSELHNVGVKEVIAHAQTRFPDKVITRVWYRYRPKDMNDMIKDLGFRKITYAAYNVE